MTEHNLANLDRIDNVEQLEDLLSQPSEAALEVFAKLEGDLILLGVAGKMGPTLARMARRASEQAGARRRIIGVARFSDPTVEGRLQDQGIDTIRCDLLDPVQLSRLPEVPTVIFMAGMKFGTTGQEARTWAMNCWLPGMVCQRFRQARIVAFSTGNVYSLSPVVQGGSVETDQLNPLGEYAMSCLGRERMFEHFSRTYEIPMVLLRLNYANEMRYGVLVDLAQRIWEDRPVDLAMGNLNAIWQADANAVALAALGRVSVPPLVLNVTGPELLSVRRVAEEYGRLFEKPVIFEGVENREALLSNAQECHRLFGYPQVSAGQMIRWIADWISRGGKTWNKPTHFEVRDGKF
jgi:nucleoside-diphosphate-sugar epimerase